MSAPVAVVTFALGAALALGAAPALAHDGPPYAILVDQPAGPYVLSVWADPDVGEGTFFVFLEPRERGFEVTGSVNVEIGVQPSSGRLPEALHGAARQKPRDGVERFEAKIPFDRAESWRVRVRVVSTAGGGEAATTVDVTPPGQGPVLDFVLYLFPFVAVGVLFVLAVRRGRAPAGRAGA